MMFMDPTISAIDQAIDRIIKIITILTTIPITIQILMEIMAIELETLITTGTIKVRIGIKAGDVLNKFNRSMFIDLLDQDPLLLFLLHIVHQF
jgi:hypothetical protein